MATVRLFGNLRAITRSKEIDIPGEMSIRELIKWLMDSYGEKIGATLLENPLESPEQWVTRTHVVILINGHSKFDLDTVIKADDRLAIFPAVVGG